MSPYPVQLTTWMTRLVSRRHPAAPSSLMASRVQVCPPEVWPSSLTWRGTLARWFNQQVKRLPEPARPLNRLALVKDEFLRLLSDVHHPHALVVSERIGRARSLRELWHLRSSVYNLLASAISQPEAERRLTQLNRHFPTRAARGPAPTETLEP